jgi:hypothetical protein
MKSVSRICALAACIAVSGSRAFAADLNGAQVFIEKLYSHYPRGMRTFDPLGPAAASIFDESFVSLLRENVRRTPKGYEGAIDWDPFCSCQDDDGMAVKIEPVRWFGPLAAKAFVQIQFAPTQPATERIELDLIAMHGQWRVHDVRTKAVPSLRAVLIKANAG